MDNPLTDIIELAATLHDRLDTAIAAWQEGYRLLGGRVHCGKGCSCCCTLAVNCTLPEAVRLSVALTAAQHCRLSGYIAGLVTAIPRMTDLKGYLDLHRKELGPCPFLEPDGSCGVYPVRPSSCRSLISTKENSWCGQDFSMLSSEEKVAFINSLDRSVVAFPMHYAAAPQEMAADAEARLTEAMRERFGYSLYGNLPLLVHMELRHRLSSRLAEGRQAVEPLFAGEGMNHPFLADFTG